MVNLKAFEQANKKYSPKEMPFLHGLKETARQKKMYQGLKILQNIPLTVEAVLKIEPLILGGADVTVTCIKSLPPSKEAIAILQAASVKVQLEHNFSETYDVCLDCCGELEHLTPKLGTIELTQTGSGRYKCNSDFSFPIISIDDSKLKYLETVFGTGNGFLRALISNVKEEIYDKKFLIFGYGKVGRGIVRELIKYTDVITVIEHDEETRKKAKKKGLKVLDAKDRKEIKHEIQDSFCVVTATGVKNLLSDVYNFNKATCGHAYLANMGAEDEYGSNFSKDEVLFSKMPLNFSIPEPTTMKYLDPILYAHNSAIEILQSNNILAGYHPFPEILAEEILRKWCLFHEEDLFDIREF